MKGMYFRVIYDINDPEGKCSEMLKECMKEELMRVYNIYADKLNDGITDKLNDEFKTLNPTYFDDNKGKEWYELVEYNQFMAEGYERLVVNELNETNISPIMNFYVNPTEVNLMGYLKTNKEITIDFTLKEVDL